MRRLLFVALIGAACAQPEVVEPPLPPVMAGDQPAVGRPLDLNVEGRGELVRLRGVTGRVMAVCVLGGGGEGAAGPADADAEAGDGAAGSGGMADDGAQRPPASPEGDRVLDACMQLQDHLQDRIVVVGLATDSDRDLDRLPLRTYRDPEGKALSESLELGPQPEVILVDRKGRVAELVPAGRLDRLEAAALRLIR